MEGAYKQAAKVQRCCKLFGSVGASSSCKLGHRILHWRPECAKLRNHRYQAYDSCTASHAALSSPRAISCRVGSVSVLHVSLNPFSIRHHRHVCRGEPSTRPLGCSAGRSSHPSRQDAVSYGLVLVLPPLSNYRKCLEASLCGRCGPVSVCQQLQRVDAPGALQEDASPAEGPALEAASALAAITAVSESLGPYLSPYLPRLLALLPSAPLLACSTAGCSASAHAILSQLAVAVPARLLFGPLAAQLPRQPPGQPVPPVHAHDQRFAYSAACWPLVHPSGLQPVDQSHLK